MEAKRENSESPANANAISDTFGVGVDIVDVARIRRMLEKYPESFAEKNFAPPEIKYCSSKADPAMHYAARFAAKEAMAKALGTGFSGGVTPLSLWVENGASGAPSAHLDKVAMNKMKLLGGRKMLISMSHLKDYAIAYAIVAK